MAIELDVRRPKLKKTSSCATMTANWTDSSFGDVEDDEAEMVARFDLLRPASVDGDAAASAARSRPWRLGLGFRGSKKK